MRDEIRTQLIVLKIKKFADLSEREKMVEQSLGLSKRAESSRVIRKRFGTLRFFSTPKRSKET